MDIANVIEKMVMLFFIMLAGFVGNKMGVLDAEGNKKFSSLVVNITAPALILASSADENLTGSKSGAIFVLVISFGIYLFLILISYITGYLFQKEPGGTGFYRFMTIFGNNAFMGIPVVEAVFGTVFYAAIFNLPNNLLIYSYGTHLLSQKSGKKSRFQWKRVLNPGTLTAFMALVMFLADLQFPKPMLNTLKTVGNITTPLSMLVIGSTLAGASLKSTFCNWKIYIFGVIKLLAVPFCILGIGMLFIKDTVTLGILTVITAMPCAAVSTMLCQECDQDSETAAKYVLVTTIMSVVTIPLVALLIMKIL